MQCSLEFETGVAGNRLNLFAAPVPGQKWADDEDDDDDDDEEEEEEVRNREYRFCGLAKGWIELFIRNASNLEN